MLRSKFHPTRDVSLALAAILLFAWMALLADRADISAFDAAGRQAVHSFARPWLTWLMKAASLVGGGWGLWPGGALMACLLARAGRGREAAQFAFAVVGANLINEGMKLFFHRLRPAPWFGYPLPATYSFPSGHAFVSFCFFLCLAEVMVGDGWPAAAKLATWGAAVSCTLLIGLSRIYLGVHYPTDVLGGFAAGIVWTTALRVAHHIWQRRAERA